MTINNKLESIAFIRNHKLNTFPEELFHKGEEKKVLEFINKYTAKYYAIRSKDEIKCLNNDYKVVEKDVLTKSNEFNLFTINVSSYNYTDNLLLIGDIMIKKDKSLYLIASTNKNYTGRMAEENPDYNLDTDIFDKRLNKIPGFKYIFEYIYI